MKKSKVVVFFFLLQSLLYSASPTPAQYIAKHIPKNMSVFSKKERFYQLLVPSIKKVHAQLMEEFLRIHSYVQNNKEQKELSKLRKKYKVSTNEALLLVLKPHPPSIVIAQAAMESAWATSRFFSKANNVFGMWSYKKNEARIAAGMKRNGKTIWLRKFDSIEDSIVAYYKLMSQGRAFKEFRRTRYETDDVFQIIKKLDKYSEIGSLYGKELGKIIRYNKLRKYDK